MHRLPKKFLFSVISCGVLSACSSSGGNFDIDSVTTLPKEEQPKSYQDDQSVAPPKETSLSTLQEPAIGYAMKLKIRNWHFKANENKALLSEEEWQSLDSPNAIDMLKQDVDNAKNTKGAIRHFDNVKIPFSPQLEYVRSGFYYNDIYSKIRPKEQIALSGFYGYLFYLGNNPAKALPTSGIVTYKGAWDFITDAEKGKSYPIYSSAASGQAGNKRSAVSDDVEKLEKINDAPEGHKDFGLSTEIQVDFGNKKLNGQLYLNTREPQTEAKTQKKKLYDLDADVHGNRFTGNAKAIEKDSIEHPFVSDSTNGLEGGFYGPNGEELAGKFLTDDRHIFAVFSAKHTGEQLTSESKFDAKKIRASWNEQSKKEDDFLVKEIDTFGDVNYLVIDGKRIPLLVDGNNDFVIQQERAMNGTTTQMRTCCSNLGYVKFGSYSVKGSGAYDLFLVGERTALADMENAAKVGGEVNYKGTWEGYLTNGKTSYSAVATNKEDGDLAEFKVNFADKKLQGELKRADSLNTVFDINGTIVGNEFTGKAATRSNGFALNPGSTTGDSRVHISTEVRGAFYGPQASELGGAFSGNELDTKDNAAVVFGAKRQVEVKP